VFLIASGGDTAALLAASGHIAHLQLVDVNPAQLALSRLKLYLLAHHEPAERLAWLGHTPMPAAERASHLERLFETLGLPANVFGPAAVVAGHGPDHVGRYEVLFAQLRAELSPFAGEIEELLTLEDSFEQVRRAAAHTPLGQGLDAAFETVMRGENLVALFGDGATQAPLFPFNRHFASRTRYALASGAARDNPFLSQMLAGRFLHAPPYPWLSVPVTRALPPISYHCATAIEALEETPEASFDFVHLSNILDWLNPATAMRTLGLAWKALRPGGLLFVRQLNSSLEIPLLEPRLHWRLEQGALLHRRDRSFFYRACHVGCKK
ncbi:MAG: DUF3419 family protein, partial [Verrucomicrobiota bacterium]